MRMLILPCAPSRRHRNGVHTCRPSAGLWGHCPHNWLTCAPDSTALARFPCQPRKPLVIPHPAGLTEVRQQEMVFVLPLPKGKYLRVCRSRWRDRDGLVPDGPPVRCRVRPRVRRSGCVCASCRTSQGMMRALATRDSNWFAVDICKSEITLAYVCATATIL